MWPASLLLSSTPLLVRSEKPGQAPDKQARAFFLTCRFSGESLTCLVWAVRIVFPCTNKNRQWCYTVLHIKCNGWPPCHCMDTKHIWVHDEPLNIRVEVLVVVCMPMTPHLDLCPTKKSNWSKCQTSGCLLKQNLPTSVLHTILLYSRAHLHCPTCKGSHPWHIWWAFSSVIETQRKWMPFFDLATACDTHHKSLLQFQPRSVCVSACVQIKCLSSTEHMWCPWLVFCTSVIDHQITGARLAEFNMQDGSAAFTGVALRGLSGQVYDVSFSGSTPYRDLVPVSSVSVTKIGVPIKHCSQAHTQHSRLIHQAAKLPTCSSCAMKAVACLQAACVQVVQ